MNFRNNYLWSAVSSMALLASNAAIAQETSATAADQPVENSATQIADIVVTANRRSERAQTVPVSVTAISGDLAQARGISDPISLSNSVPGLTIARAPATTTPFLRGIGSTAGSIGSEPSVSMYVDDVYTPAAGAFVSGFGNVSRLEVLKGPQGTLFGRNATGGVIQVFTRNPTQDTRFDFNVGYASYDTVDGSLYVSGGLSDNVSANLSVYGSKQGEGWGKNVTTGNDSYQINWNHGGRAKLLLEPSDATTILLTAFYDQTASSQGAFNPAPGTVAYGAFPGTPGFYDSVDSTDPYFRNTQTGVSAKITQDMDWATLVSISAYTRFKQFLLQNQAGSQFPLLQLNVNGGNKTFTQELQLQSPTGSDVSWLAGMFYMNDRASYDPLNIFGIAFPGTGLEIYSTQQTNSYSAFGQATVPILENTRVTAGLRYTYDDRSLEAVTSIPGVFTAPAPNSPQSKAFKKLTWRFALDHRVTPDVMVYASYNRGFRSGGYNTVVFPGAPIAAPVDPETLDAFAIGEKAEFLNRSVQLNIEAFYYKFNKIQVQTLVNGGTIQSNAASATIKGVDVDLTVIPVDNLTLTAALEYLDAKYDDYKTGSINVYAPGCAPGQSNCAVAADLSGFKLPNAAPFSASVSANYLLPTSVGDFNLNVSYNHGGKYYYNPDNGVGQLSQSLNRQRTLNLINATLMWTSPSKAVDISVWGKNITDQKYLTNANEQTVGTAWGPAPPATFGVTVGFHVL